MKETSKKESMHKKTKQTSLCFVFSLSLFFFSFLSFFSFTNTSYGAGADITVSTSTSWAAGTYDYGTVTVTNNSTLTLNSTTSGSGLTATGSGVIINADNIIVDAGSKISANGTGFTAGTGTNRGNGPGSGGQNGSCGGGGGGYGGTGGTGNSGAGGITYGSNTQPISLGSGGGGSGGCSPASGNGGGAIQLVISGTFTNNGNTTANGGNASSGYTSGGSGGSIWIDAGTIVGSGSITSNGGTGGNSYGGGGGGGRIAVYYNTKTYSGTVTVTGGTGYQAGGAGTIYNKDKAGAGTLTVNGTGPTRILVGETGVDALVVSGGNTTTFNSGTYNYGPITVSGSSTVTFSAVYDYSTPTVGTGSTVNLPSGTYTTLSSLSTGGGRVVFLGASTFSALSTISGTSLVSFTAGTYTFGSLTVTGNSTLTLNSTISGSGLAATGSGVIINADNIVVDAGSSISANVTGFTSSASSVGKGPGGGGYIGSCYVGGGGYGGTGGAGGGAAGGVTYGSNTQPINLGSSGAGVGCSGTSGSGGGAIKLIISGTFTNNGITTANGGNASSGYTSGGSGGSIWIDAGTLAGSGSLTSNGGTGSGYGGGGAGGRIALYYNTNTYSGTATATGGTGTNAGGAGTIYQSTTIPNPPTSTIVYPINNGLTVSTVVNGTTVAGSDGIQKVQVAIAKSSNGYFYNGATFVSSASMVWLDATGTTSFSYTASSSAFVLGSTYYVYSRAQDNLGNYEAPKQSYFTYATLSSTFTSPVNNSVNPSTTFTGTSTANSINTIKISIQELDTNKYYNGSTFASDTEVWITTTGTSGWSYDASGVPFLSGTVYKLRSRAEDPYGTVETPSAGINFLKFAGLIISTNTTWSTNQNIDSNGFLVTNNATLTINAGVTVTNAGPVLLSNASSGRIIVAGTSTILTGTAFKVIAGTAVFDVNKDIVTPPTFSSILVSTGATLTHSANTSVHTYSLILSSTGNATVDGTISANGKGFTGVVNAAGNGPGGGSMICHGAGAGYGGTGGNGDTGALGGVTYGSLTQPIDLGSGGGGACSSYIGSTGGGAIKLLVSGTTTNNGTISSNANNSASAGSGSGGSIWIDTYAFTGNGIMTANGGTGALGGGGGAGGRVALYYATKTYTGTVTATGGSGANAGGVGTVYDYHKPFYSSGTFTSAVINFGIPISPATLTYTKTTPANTTLTVDIRAGNTATPDGTWTDWTMNTDVASGGSIASLSGNRYFQYRANLATTSQFVTPSLDNLTINYTQYTLSGNLTSSIYNTGSPSNILASVGWVATNTSGTETVRFQLRSSSDGNTWSAWCGYADCSGSTYFNAADNGVALSGSHPLQLGGDDQYFQYKTFLASAGAYTPSISSISIRYVVNSPPEFDTSFGTNGITISQVSDSSDPNWEKMKIDYRIRDIDTTTGTDTPNNITPSLQYNTGSGFTAITAGYLSATALDNKAVEESNYTTYTAYWDAKSQIPETSINTLQIKVTVNDNEAANNTAFATDTSLSIDTKNPTIGATPILVDASTTPATLTLSTTDDNSIQMKVSLNNDLSGASYETYNTTKTITLASDPDTIYIKYRDSYGNETATQSITTPETPTRMMVQDTSNLYAPPLQAEYRLFVAWGTVLPTTPAFASYKIYRSPDNITYTLLDTINSRTTNYYGDNSIAFDTLYYYKVETRDVNGNISYQSLPVSGKANGIQDAGEGGGGAETTAPTISTVTSTALSTTEATITWETNELATSTVGFTGTPSTFTNQIGVEGYTDNQAGTGLHKVVLSGLTPNKQYYYQILSSDPSHNQGIANNGGGGYTFTTNPGPAISGVALSNASNTKATITWNTDISADSTIRYATSVTGGSLVSPLETGTGTEVTSHSVLLTSLSSGTTYYFSVKSQHNSDIATDTNGGAFYQFITTSDTTPPTISSLSAGVIAFDRAALTWLTDEQATSQIKYATISGGPYTDTTETVTYGSDHFVILPNLTSDTTYYFKAYSSDLSGNHTLSPQNSFKTLQDPSYQHSPLTEITDMSATLITDTNAVISLTTDQPALCSIEYGTAPGNYTATPVTEALENKQHRITLPSLLFATTYSYQATCIDNLNTSVPSDEASFITLTEQVATGSEVGDVTAPSISGVGTSAVSGENATVTWTTDEVGNGYVNYGITADYGKMAGESLVNKTISTYATDHTVILTDLIPSTKYYYVVLSSDAKGNLATSSESSFTTTSPSTISSISILSTKIGEATLTWKTSTNMSSIIEYGLTETYGNKQESTTQSQDHTITVSKLKSNVLYHFRVKGQDKDKNLYASSDYTYEPKSPPQLRNIQSKVLSDNEAQIDFISSVPTDALITYTNTKDPKDQGSQGTPELQTTHSIILKNLTPGATYTGNIIAKDEAGNEVTDVFKNFTTSQDTTPPVIDQMKTDMALSQDGKVQAITSFTTNEPTTQSVTYKEGTDGEEKTAGVKTEYTTSHIAIITTFKPGSVYFLTAHTTDKSGNETTSKERMIITPQRTENVVQMIISNFNDIFSWAKL